MYNKLFTKILDSSIWLAPDPHRLVWITLIAAMDQNGYAQFACIENLAARARVSTDATRQAIATFQEPDPFDPTQPFEGRRIERMEGGWLILNAEKYRNLVTRAVANEQARIRMKKHRDRNAVTQQLRSVTPSVSVSVSVSESESESDTRVRGENIRVPLSPTKSPEVPLSDSESPEDGRRGLPRASRSTATRLSADWTLTQERSDYAKAQAIDPLRAFENFLDYWTAASGAKARKHDWDATWRMWCRREASQPAKTYRRVSMAKSVAQLEQEERDAEQRQTTV